MNKHERDLHRLIAREGAHIIDSSTTGGNHLKFRISADGRQKTLFMATTPSDRKSLQQTRAQVRRFVRGIR